ncbi:MAG: glycosyltransferase family 39 protein [Candidatus Margulisiibacteriota bacterium]
MYFVIFLVAINLFKLATARFFPLIGDEAYYWLWSQHLDLSYVDHPPMIAYVNHLLTFLFGQNEMAVRLGAILIVLLISWIIYLTGRALHGERFGQLSAVLFNLVPTFFGGGMFLVPQTVLFLFWSLSFYLMVKLIKTGKSYYWYLLGLSAGLGLLSDYVMALFFVGTVVYCAVNKEQRYWLTRKEPYLAVLLSLLIFSPVLLWNLRLGFTPLFYWGGKMGAGPRIGDNLLNFFGLQMLLYTPPVFFLTFYLIFKGKDLLAKLYAAAVFLPFLLISPLINVGGHWPSTSYLPALIEISRSKKWVIWTMVGFALFVNSVGFAYYLWLYPTPAELKGKEFTINQQLPQFIKDSAPKTGRTWVFANDLGMVGLVTFHGKTRAYMAPGRLKQVDLWGKPELQKGDNIIYFALNETPLYDKLKLSFRKVWIEPNKRIFNKDANLPTLTQIYHAAGYKGGLIP